LLNEKPKTAFLCYFFAPTDWGYNSSPMMKKDSEKLKTSKSGDYIYFKNLFILSMFKIYIMLTI